MSSAGVASIGCTGRCRATAKRARPAAAPFALPARRARPRRGGRRPSRRGARRRPGGRRRRRSRRASRPRARPGAARRRAGGRGSPARRRWRARTARAASRCAPRPSPCRSSPATSASARVDVAQRQLRLGRGRAAQRRERRPADADPALARLAREPGDGDLDLVGRRAAQQRGDRVALGEPARRLGGALGRRDEGGEEGGHRAIRGAAPSSNAAGPWESVGSSGFAFEHWQVVAEGDSRSAPPRPAKLRPGRRCRRFVASGCRASPVPVTMRTTAWPHDHGSRRQVAPAEPSPWTQHSRQNRQRSRRAGAVHAGRRRASASRRSTSSAASRCSASS